MGNDTRVPLDESELESAVGGITDGERLAKLNELWRPVVPKEIYDVIVKTFRQYGCKAAVSVGTKLLADEKLAYLRPMLNLFR